MNLAALNFDLFNVPDVGWALVLLSPFLMGLLNSSTKSTSQDAKAGASDSSQAATTGGVAVTELGDSSVVAGQGATVARDDAVNLGGAYKSTVTSTQVKDSGILNYGSISSNQGVQVSGIGGDLILGDGGAANASLADSLTTKFSDTVKNILSTSAATSQAFANAAASQSVNSAAGSQGLAQSLGAQIQTAVAGLRDLATAKATDGLSIGAKVILAGLGVLAMALFFGRRGK